MILPVSPLKESDLPSFSWAWCLLLATLSVVVQMAFMDAHVIVYDEGLTLYGSQVVGEGGLPYRDFWSLYGPASFYVVAGAFKLLAATVLAERSVDLLYKTAIALLVFVLAGRLATRGIAALAAMTSLFLLIGAASYGAPIFAATAFGLVAVALANESSAKGGSLARWIGAGVAVGVTSAFRTDIGVYTFIVCLSGWLYRMVFFADDRSVQLQKLLAFVVAAIFVAAGWIVPMLWAVPFQDLKNDFFIIPFQIYARNRHLPFPVLDPLRAIKYDGDWRALTQYVVYLPFPIVALAMFNLAKLPRRRSVPAGLHSPRSPADGRSELVCMVVLLDLFMILKGWTRTSILHMTPALCVSAILSAYLLRDTSNAAKGVLTTVALAVAVLVGVDSEALSGARSRIERITIAFRDGRWQDVCHSAGNTRLGCFKIDPDLSAVAAYVEGHTSQGGAIFVGGSRHDKVFANAVALYFLTGRTAPTKWHDLHPGVQTTLAIQREMIADFEQRRPELVVLDSHYENQREPNDSSVSSGVHALDDWLHAHYTPVMTRGTYIVLEPVQPT